MNIIEYNINITTFILLVLIVYSSSFLGYYIYRLAKDEVDNNIVLLKIFSKLTFLLINIIFFYYVFKDNIVLLTLILLSILLVVLKAKIEYNMYFLYLAIIFSLSYFYNVYFYYIIILTFIYNLTISSIESKNKKYKKILLKKTGFIIINLISILWYYII